ncbi:GNAT family N-acetyltransferase [Enterococcus alishanensis]|uniref:GNAT family N-acetyltransferase n=1 Tax=Enterococcus alishanensis TaxID=1303817 RepID=A0ABS6TEA3_9ENTE|nr:GNAT family N-acetyltransferase [Enterococcus alishanensis]MBV7391249.1 GNAT family N-acetyltransferase [Enterococcus alishanensis]
MDTEIKVTYRNPTEDDAKNIVDFYNLVGGETTYLSFEENEYPLNVKEVKELIINTNHQINSTILLALINGKIIGIGTVSSGNKVKSKHCGELGIVVTEKFQSIGIGKEIIYQLLTWAKSNGVTTKIQLDTRVDNKKAVKLYKKFGFKIEGKLENTTIIEGKYYDLYVMGLML